MRKSFLALLLVIVCCLMDCVALADGSCGAGLTWDLSSSGVLTISGTGDMMDCSYGEAPWHDKNDSIQSVVVEEGVTSLGDYAFYWCRELKTVQLPESLTSLGEQTFENCCELVSVNIPSKVTSIGSWTFYGCEKLASLTLPEGLTSIEELAFCDCKSLHELTIPALNVCSCHLLLCCTQRQDFPCPPRISMILLDNPVPSKACRRLCAIPNKYGFNN